MLLFFTRFLTLFFNATDVVECCVLTHFSHKPCDVLFCCTIVCGVAIFRNAYDTL